jgi:4-amino-4-deoxy-L-arabinose transferase-like glycosyltransferase
VIDVREGRKAEAQGGREIPLAILYPLFFVAVYLSHWTLLRLPYFWDEGGYYIPAAYDFFRNGTLIPQSTLTNAHPPMPSLLLAGWWHLSGFVISGTRTLVCLVSSAALLAVYRVGRRMAGELVGWLAALLTAVYPIWFAQSTLAHADIFAAAFTLWALSFYLTPDRDDGAGNGKERALVAGLFSLAALSKETAIVTPVALACFEAWRAMRARTAAASAWRWVIALAFPVLPLLAWYGYHYSQTSYVFGNPEYLRYNATANLSVYRIGLCLWHRLLHLTAHMNLFVATLCTMAAALMPVRPGREGHGVPRRAGERILVIVLVNWVAFSVLGGALLTRYFLPIYPLLLVVCVTTWLERMRWWPAVAGLTFSAFIAGIFLNPPYAFAPEDNLTYRDMIVLHKEAAAVIATRYPQATVLTAWPATAELERPELGYVRMPIKVTGVGNFSPAQMEKAAADPGSYDVALLFSTKWEPAAGAMNMARGYEKTDAKYFDFHHDLSPEEAARMLHGDVVWQARRMGEWAAVLHFPRVVNARLRP